MSASRTMTEEISEITPENTDVVIEFTAPESALNNIKSCTDQ